MSEDLIVRIHSDSYDVEVAKRDAQGNMQFKTISLDQFEKIIRKYTENNDPKNIKLCTEEIIGYGDNCVLIKQEERKRVIMYTNHQETKAYNISFPNALYIVHYIDDSIRNIEMYSYKKYKGKNTELYEYPMPNELTSNKLCIGSAPRTIINGDIVKALETIIFTPYSHRTFSSVKGFSDSEKWFEYLSKNKFPYKLLKSLNRKLESVLKG